MPSRLLRAARRYLDPLSLWCLIAVAVHTVSDYLRNGATAWIEGWKRIAVPGDYGNVNSYMWVPILGPLLGAASSLRHVRQMPDT